VININFGLISHRFRDMASFSLKSAHFFYTLFCLTPVLKMFLLHYSTESLRASFKDTELIIPVKGYSIRSTAIRTRSWFLCLLFSVFF